MSAMASVLPMSRPAPPANPGGASVSLRGLQKSFGERKVLRAISLEITRGLFVSIVGRSGCGKTTLLRLIAGLEKPDAGELNIACESGTTTRGSNSDVRLMFQDARLLPWKSVIDNVRLGMSKADVPIAMEALRDVGLEDRAADWPATLSGGQRQRVALARALVRRPKLLLLDEPLGALDALTRMEMHALIERLWLQNGFTTLLVTHDVQEAVALADRVIVLGDGAIVFDETVNLPRPRIRGRREFAALEDRVLREVLRI
jgi:sulfonate transport system ATP-binding protein